LKGKYYVRFLEELTIAHGAEDVTTNYTNCIIAVVIYIKVQWLRWVGHIQRAPKDYLPKKNSIRGR